MKKEKTLLLVRSFPDEVHIWRIWSYRDYTTKILFVDSDLGDKMETLFFWISPAGIYVMDFNKDNAIHEFIRKNCILNTIPFYELTEVQNAHIPDMIHAICRENEDVTHWDTYSLLKELQESGDKDDLPESPRESRVIAFSRNLNILQKKTGKTWKQIYDETGLSHTYIRCMRSDLKSNPSLKVLDLLCHSLDASMDDLVYVPDDRRMKGNQLSSVANRFYTNMILTFMELDHDDQKTILRLMSFMQTGRVMPEEPPSPG